MNEAQISQIMDEIEDEPFEDFDDSDDDPNYEEKKDNSSSSSEDEEEEDDEVAGPSGRASEVVVTFNGPVERADADTDKDSGKYYCKIMQYQPKQTVDNQFGYVCLY